DLLFRFRQRVRLKPANSFEVIPERTRSGHEPARVVLIDALPPQVEKHQSVVECREALLDLGLKRTRGEVFRIFGEPEIGIGADPGRYSRDVFVESQQRAED